jgi:DNA-binding transcriptional ArsR family regulator
MALTPAAGLDPTLAALADPHRRQVIELLREKPRRAGELAESVGLNPPALSRHLRTLKAGGLVEEAHREFDARVRVYRLKPGPMADLKAGWSGQNSYGPSSSPPSGFIWSIPGDFADTGIAAHCSGTGAGIRSVRMRNRSWWRPNALFRFTSHPVGVVAFEPGLGGRFTETSADGEVFEIGRITVWEPGLRLAFTWRQASFAPGQTTEVEVRFEPVGNETRVTVEHRGWETIPQQHVARHAFPDAIFLQRHGE